jgi:hypothetical protein
MAKTKTMKVTMEEEPRPSMPVPDAWFINTHPTVAGDAAAPKPPSAFSGAVETFVTKPIERIRTELQKIMKKDPLALVCAVAFGLTDSFLLNILANMNTLAIVQKTFTSPGLLEKYLRLGCKIPRGDMPGNIFSHLVRKDGQDDLGILDGLRWLGDFTITTRLLKNEARPYLHSKLLIVMIHDDKGNLIPHVAYLGSANFTANAEKGFELINRTQDIDYISKLFDVFGYYWSLSEGLYNFSQGLTPTYTWLKKPGKFTAAVCKCGVSSSLKTSWVNGDDKEYYPHRVLRCEKCGGSMPFLKEHQPVIR